MFTHYNRFVAATEAINLGLRPYKILSDKNNDLPYKFNHGEGCFINKGVVIGSQSTIENFVFINRGASLGHHLYLDNFVSIGPGVVTGGNVTIERGSSIGVGAVILPEIKIGKHAVIGAGSVVTKDVKDYSVVIGNPAKKNRENDINF